MEFSQSLRVTGMGGAGVALSDGSSVFINPAHIAFPTNDFTLRVVSVPKMRFASAPTGSQWDVFALSVMYEFIDRDTENLNRLRLCGGLDYIGHKWSSGQPGFSSLPGIDSDWDEFVATVSAGVEEVVQVSGGLSFEYSKVYAGNESDISVMFGFLIGFPDPSFYVTQVDSGSTVFNILPTIGFSYSAGNRYNLQDGQVKQFGIAIDFSLDSNDGAGEFSIFQVTPSFSSISRGSSICSFGCEIGVYDALFFRGGLMCRPYTARRVSARR